MKTRQFQGIKVRLDRPKGFVQEGKDDDGKPWQRVYKYDYGFVPKTQGGDGDGLDVFLGPDESSTMSFWAIQKKDGKFDEYKVFLGFPNKKAARKAYIEHIPEKFLSGIVSMPVEMMKALVGVIPYEKIASRVAFLDELCKIAGVP
jgi:hypothetical protein